MQKHRISTNIGRNQKVIVELSQTWDLLEILSLRFTQIDAYTSMCSDYGVVVGRISANNGLGMPNARVSIFIPIQDEDVDNPVISALYPFTTVSERNEQNYRYNLLPSRQQHGGHSPTGTFPDQIDILTREEVLEVYEKYYKYTVKTNESGDFMIWGVPVGVQTIHVDVDLSDIGCFSLRPDDFIRQGVGVDSFKNSYTFKSSQDIDSLPQIVSFDQSIEVYPFWGNEDLCEIGITRTDFDLSSKGIKIEPTAYVIGSIYSDQGTNTVNKNCSVKGKMGRKCDLTTFGAVIEMIRFTPFTDENGRPQLEHYEVNEDIDDDGTFVLPIPMNMDYLYTNEFGENEYTNNPNKGIATSSCYRLRISGKNETLGRVRTVASYLVPNIREYTNDVDKSYAFTTNWDDYPTSAVSDSTVVFKTIQGSYYPEDYFYRLTYNKVYTISSFMGSEYGLKGDNFLGLKEIVPKEDDDCESSVLTPPTNFAIRKFSFGILLAIIINAFERVMYIAFINVIQVIIIPLQLLWSFHIRKWRPFGFFDLIIEQLQRLGTLHLGIVTYPDCESCDEVEDDREITEVTDDPSERYQKVGDGIAIRDILTNSNIPSSPFTPYCHPDTTKNELILSGGTSSYVPFSGQPQTLDLIEFNILSTPSVVYYIKLKEYHPHSGATPSDIANLTGLTVNTYTQLNLERFSSCSGGYLHDDSNNNNTWLRWFSAGTSTTEYVWTGVTYEIYSSNVLITGNTTTHGINELSLPTGCKSYSRIYNDDPDDYNSISIKQTYCAVSTDVPYTGATSVDGMVCSNPGDIIVGQAIYENESNPCRTCSTRSGFSEFRYGVFTIIPAAGFANWKPNKLAIKEYSSRKLVAKMFCEGIINFSFVDNWLSGSLYMFPFKSKVKWNKEEILDLNNRGTKYCEHLVHFKTKEESSGGAVKRFYYKSTKYDPTLDRFSLTPIGVNINKPTLGHPTTMVDMGPRDEFIKEICVDPSLDPNCSVVRSIGSSSYQNMKEMIWLYIDYRTEGNLYSYLGFLQNDWSCTRGILLIL